MRNGLLLLTAAAVGVLGLPATAAAEPVGPGIDPEMMAAAVDELHEVTDASVVVEVRDGDDVWTTARGDRDEWTGVDTKATDRVRLASLTKSMVTTVALQLVDEGVIALDDTVESRMPGLLPYDEDVTIEQLLGHTSGVPDYFLKLYPSLAELSADDVRTGRYRHVEPERIVEAATEDPLLFEPGSWFSYSNTNYYIAGLLIEDATGRDLESLVTSRVLRPSGMDSSYFTKRLPFLLWPAPNATMLTGEPDDPSIDTSGLSPSHMWAAGGVAGNARDVNRFYRALYDGSLLPAHLLEKAVTPSDGAVAAGVGYGLGTQMVPIQCPGMPGGVALGHTGGGLGYSTYSFHSIDGERQVTFTYMSDVQLAPPADLVPALDRALIAGLCSIDIAAPTTATSVPTVDVEVPFLRVGPLPVDRRW